MRATRWRRKRSSRSSAHSPLPHRNDPKAAIPNPPLSGVPRGSMAQTTCGSMIHQLRTFVSYGTIVMIRRAMTAATIAFAIFPMTSYACSYGPVSNAPSKIKAAAKRSYDRAVAVVDLEVLEAANLKGSSKSRQAGHRFRRYKVIRSWKGNLAVGRLIRIPNLGICDITPQGAAKGRVLLEIYQGFLWMNGALNGAAYNTIAFNHEIDALIVSAKTSPHFRRR